MWRFQDLLVKSVAGFALTVALIG